MNKRYTGRPSLKWLFEDADPNKIPNDKFPMQLSAVKAELAKQLNIDVKIINDIEAKKSPYNKKLYCSIMRKLGVDSNTLKDILI